MKLYTLHEVIGLLIVPLILSIPILTIANDELNTLVLFRAIEEKNAAAIKNSSTYNRLSIRISNREYKYLIEPKHAYIVLRDSIELVKVLKSKPVDSQRSVDKFFYTLNVTITSTEAKRFIAFIKKNKEETFQLKIGDQSLGVTQFLWPLEMNKLGKLELTVMLREYNLDELKKTLAPIERKVVYE